MPGTVPGRDRVSGGDDRRDRVSRLHRAGGSGLDSGGNKHVLGLREGTTENSGVARALLSDLIRRGLSTERRLLFVIDGSGALRRAIGKIFGSVALVQRCQVHKIRNVLDHLPEEYHASVRKAMFEAYGTASVKLARKQPMRLADSLRDAHPGAAASLEEGLDETLALQELGFSEGPLWVTLRSTNPNENLDGGMAEFTRNVKRWRGGSMILRRVSSAVLEAETR
ncbi:MAG: transposase, partial [Acidobacteriota bacterium]|nr:transposase [Acidobacteriota bacterium]